jgi:hypothetical protein
VTAVDGQATAIRYQHLSALIFHKLTEFGLTNGLELLDLF